MLEFDFTQVVNSDQEKANAAPAELDERHPKWSQEEAIRPFKDQDELQVLAGDYLQTAPYFAFHLIHPIVQECLDKALNREWIWF